MLFYYVRHGKPIYDPDSLTEEGEIQAEALSKRFEITKLDKIYASSSNRAIQTAKPTAEKLKLDINILDWCNECYAWEEFNTGNNNWIFNDSNFLEAFTSEKTYNLGFKWYEQEIFKNTKCAEGMKRVGKNADELLLSLGYKHDNENHCYIPINHNEKRIALFAHEGMSKIFLSHILDIPYPIFARFLISHTGVTVINFALEDDGKVYAKLFQHSNDSHLYKENIETKYNGSLLI